MNPLGGFSLDDARKIHERVLGQSFSQKLLDAQKLRTVQNDSYYVELLEDLPAATDHLTGYSQAECRIVRYMQPLQSDSLDMELAADSVYTNIIVTNRNVNFSAATGDLLFVIRSGAEWVPAPSGGGGSTVSSNSCCGCIDNGNIIVDSIETSSKMNVSLNDVYLYQSNGYIKLPAGVYELIYSSGSGTWTLDVGDFLVAFYNDGSSATSATTMDATLTFDNAVGGKSQLQLCITGTVGQSVSVTAGVAGATNGWTTGYYSGYTSVKSYTGTADTTPGTGSGTFLGWTGTYAEFYNEAWEAFYTDGYPYGTSAASDAGTSTDCGQALYFWNGSSWVLYHNCTGSRFGTGCSSTAPVGAPTGTSEFVNYRLVDCTGTPSAGTGIGPGP